MKLTEQYLPASPSNGAFAPVSTNKGSADQSFPFSREIQTWNSYMKYFQFLKKKQNSIPGWAKQNISEGHIWAEDHQFSTTHLGH